MSIYNPVGYDRPKRLYVQESSLAWRPLLAHFCADLPRSIRDIWGVFRLLNLAFSDLLVICKIG